VPSGASVRLAAAVLPRATYIGLVAISFAWAFARPEAEGQSFAINLGNAIGFAALAMLVLQLLAPAPRRMSKAPFRRTFLLRFHGPLGYLTFAAAIGHVVILIVDDPDRLTLLNPADAPARARAAVAALVALALVTVASTRRRVGRQTRAWRGLHVLLGGAALAFALGHVAGVGKYLGLDALPATALALVPLAAFAFLYLRREPERSPDA